MDEKKVPPWTDGMMRKDEDPGTEGVIYEGVHNGPVQADGVIYTEVDVGPVRGDGLIHEDELPLMQQYLIHEALCLLKVGRVIHDEEHYLAGKTVQLEGGVEFQVEDWADRVYGKSIWAADGNPAAICYAVRRALTDLPLDNEILYGKIDGLGILIHVSELYLRAGER